jgi:hypothetical protein
MNCKTINNPEQISDLFSKTNVAKLLDIPEQQIRSIVYNNQDKSAHVDFAEIITFPLPSGFTINGQKRTELCGMDFYFSAEDNRLRIKSLYLVESLEAQVPTFGSMAGNILDFNERNQLISVRGLRDVLMKDGTRLKLQALYLFPNIKSRESFFENCFIEFVPGVKVKQNLGNQETLGLLCSYNTNFPEIFLREPVSIPIPFSENSTAKVKSLISNPIDHAAALFFEEPVAIEDGVLIATVIMKINNNNEAVPVMWQTVDDVQIYKSSESSRLLNEQLRDRLGLASRQAEAVKIDENWLWQHSGIHKEKIANITQSLNTGDYYVKFNPGFNKYMPVVLETEVSEYSYDCEGVWFGARFSQPVKTEIKTLPHLPNIQVSVSGISLDRNQGEYILFLSEPFQNFTYLQVNSKGRLQDAFTILFSDNNMLLFRNLKHELYAGEKHDNYITRFKLFSPPIPPSK